VKVRLTPEEQEYLHVFVDSEGYSGLIKILDACVQSQAANVLRYDVSNGSDRVLAMLKASSDGAKKLSSDLQTQLKAYKPS
jgi:hypothetical protein